MTELPLFYASIELLNSERHRNLRLRAPARPFAFAETAQLIPAVVDEYATAARDMTVVFAPNGAQWSSVFLCGLKSGSNLYVDADGRWNGAYVPAYLRRYPFILGDRDGMDPVVCMDVRFDGLSEEGEGARLFDDEGKHAPTLDNAVRLVADFANAARRTEEFCRLMAEHDLLKSVTIDVQGPKGGANASIHGLAIIDEAKLNALPAEVFEDLRRKGLIGVIYGHLFSLGATRGLAGKLEARDTAAAVHADATLG